jgi:hypothetical protein
MFTGELYSSNTHVWEQISNQVGKVGVDAHSESYFGIYPRFVSQEMKGTCTNATVVMMGCHGMTYTDMAESFIEKGATTYVGWDGPVMADYVDYATTHFLTYFIVENRTIDESVKQVRKTIGPDPTFGSVLLAYHKD